MMAFVIKFLAIVLMFCVADLALFGLINLILLINFKKTERKSNKTWEDWGDDGK